MAPVIQFYALLIIINQHISAYKLNFNECDTSDHATRPIRDDGDRCCQLTAVAESAVRRDRRISFMTTART